MDKRELQIIEELMAELQGQMEYGADDFEERLGRKKPEAEIKKAMTSPDAEIEVTQVEMPEDETSEEGTEDDMMDEESPEEKLKSRLMKLRGR